MEFTTIKAMSASTPSVLGGMSARDRFTAFWTDTSNVLYPVGQLLATVVSGKSLAQWLIDGEAFGLTHIDIAGTAYPLAEGFSLSLASLDSWHCEACKDVHGVKGWPKKPANVKLLAHNSFYYDPANLSLHVISDTCFGLYVRDILVTKMGEGLERCSVPKAKATPATPRANRRDRTATVSESKAIALIA